ncbi:hypothetical protein EV644_106429 [Kribbella orskensis]|uniref:Uncharacterized protein n=1 Tax=Kribbella orskensis TaxID=2512216 RepID=A0ABY2BKH7_9ACTN|nr:hypothetical protein EV642_105429 [Kribbella sp. VKM Ac-2500]TCO23120.1 hypothetical protein EV644_106429 [Kribbella orskensis]
MAAADRDSGGALGHRLDSLWIAKLYVSERTALKVEGRHKLSVQALYDHLVGQAGLRYVWDDDPERGRRAILEIYLGDQRVLVVLYPADDPFGDAWNLGSAYPLDS